MQIGATNSLYIKRFSAHGAYLESKNNNNEVLLPKKFLTDNLKVGDLVEVFIHTDSQDRIVATTQKPFAKCNEIAILEIRSIGSFGCFLHIGLDKDIFMPTKNPSLFKVGQKVCVFITLDKQNRLIAKLGIKNFLKPFRKNHKRFLKLPAFGFEKTPLGIGCVVDNQYYGILYQTDLKDQITLFKPLVVQINKIRPDGKLDLILDYSKAIQNVLNTLKTHKTLPLNLDSSPQDIQSTFGISKKLFKKTISNLIQNKEAEIKNNQIHFIRDNKN